MSGPYAGYVLSAYAIGLGAVVLVAAWAVLERRGARAELRRAERAVNRQGTESDGR